MGALQARLIRRAAEVPVQSSQLAGGVEEEPGDHHRLGRGALHVAGRLERLVGLGGEAVEVEAVVPVGVPDQRQRMRAAVLQRVADAGLEVVQEVVPAARPVGVADGRFEDRRVSRLLDVCAGGEDQPEVVVIEVAADLGIPLLGEGLVLVVAGAVGELCRGQVEDALPCTVGDQVDEAEQILVGVAEAHPPPDSRLVEAGRAREVERGHALVLVPAVEHSPDARFGAVDLERRQEALPHLVERVEGGLDRAGLCVLLEQAARLRLVHDARPLELRLLALVDVGEHEREGL